MATRSGRSATGRFGWASVSAVAFMASGCATPPGPAERRATHSATTSPGGDVSWVEVTILGQTLVQAEATDRAARMGFAKPEAHRRGEVAWLDLHGKAEGGPVLEVWMSTTCEECLDLRRWSWSLVNARDGVSHQPRWTESEVMRQQEETRTVLDASRTLTRSWVRGRLAFARSDIATDGRIDLRMGRPEAWAAPVSVRWWRGRLDAFERAHAWLTGGSP